jgi:hypothetical protein
MPLVQNFPVPAGNLSRQGFLSFPEPIPLSTLYLKQSLGFAYFFPKILKNYGLSQHT